MERSLEKQKNEGAIYFIKVPSTLTNKNKQFIVRDVKTRKLSVIFYDNKYRQDTLDEETFRKKLNEQLSSLKCGLNDIGVYNTKDSYDEVYKQLEFLEQT